MIVLSTTEINKGIVTFVVIFLSAAIMALSIFPDMISSVFPYIDVTENDVNKTYYY